LKAPGLRLITLGGVPSPWSEAAKGIFHVKRLSFAVARLLPGDKRVRDATGVRNAPVVLYGDELPRSGWAEILALGERLAPEPALVPADAERRVSMFGLANELMGEDGLLWSARVLTIAASFESEGARGFPAPLAAYLGRRYGFRSEAEP